MRARRTGIGEYTFELLNAIFDIDKKNDYSLFYNSHADISKNIPKWEQPNVRYVATRRPNKLFNGTIKLFNTPRLDNLLGVKLDAFYSPNLNFTAISKKTKFVLTVHDLSFEIFSDFFTAKTSLWHKIISPKKQCLRADMILTPSENTRRDIVDFYGINKNKIKVLYPGLSSVFLKKQSADTEQIKKKYALPDKFILFLGAIEPRKNILGIIEGFEKIASSLPNSYSLIIAGADGWKTEKIYEPARVSHCREKIKFIGYVAPEDKPPLYAAADLFVYPSFYEGFGFPVLEAMACGTPVITSNRSSLPEVAGGDSAWLVNPNRTDEIAYAMFMMLTNDNLKKSFVQKGFEQSKKFNWQKTAAQWIDLIKN